jgi:hypothetical protein
MTATVTSSRFEIDANPAAVQQIVPMSRSARFEGVDFSTSGDTLAVATSETNAVLMFRRNGEGRFEETPFRTLGGPPVGLDYPHDVAFSMCDGTEFMAVAQRTGAIAIYRKDAADGRDDQPVFEISGPQSRLSYSDGVKFVPPDNDYLAACNLLRSNISFFRRRSRSPIAFENSPEFELEHAKIFEPDGLAFSRCGRWLAVANHGQQTVSIFERRKTFLLGRLRYGPEPVTVLEESELRYPHSVAFTPGNHLIVTNAGANYFNVYAPRPHGFGMQWEQTPVAQVNAHDSEAFKAVNLANKMEGGPKGVAVHGNRLAVCSPQMGVKIYPFRE